jgi:hypothetical protein
MHSTSTCIELVTAAAGDTLTATAAVGSVSRGIAIGSEPQLQVFIDYTPHADNVGNAAVYANIELIYSEQAPDYEDVSGGSGTRTWKSYVVEEALSVGSGLFISEFLIKQWRVHADNTDSKDRDPTFSVPLAAKMVNLKIWETGMGTKFGAIIGKIGHQPLA